MRAIILALACCSLSACYPLRVTPVISDCPALVDYPPEYQEAAADELRQLKQANHAPHIRQMITDYGAERKALEKCQ
ncbi:MAG: hypothetical protein E6Q98_16150 [Rhodospirillaceae bacterium]|nr:MAG: hypothetical protein E6Q98_16150 [Rhodospirillaceae bacterium]